MTLSINRRSLLAAAGVSAVGATALLSACSGDDQTAAPSDGTLSGSINVWGGVPAENGPKALCDAFMAANPGTTVTYTRFVNDDQGNLKLDTALQGGSEIDVFTSYAMPLLAQRAKAGLAQDLSARIAAEPDFAAYKADADPIQNFVADGKVYAIPAQTSPTVVLANKTMLDAAGITPPTAWTVDEYHEMAKQLTKSGSVNGSFNAPGLANQTLGSNAAYAKDGKSSNFSNPAFRKDLELQLAMQADGSSMPMKTVLAEKLQVYTQGPFLQGRVAMINTQLFLVRYISNLKEFPHDFQTIALPMPSPSKDDQGWNTGAVGDLLSINSKSKNPELAWALISFWMKNAAKYLTPGGRLPSLVGTETPDSLLSALLGSDMEKIYDVPSFKKVLFEDKQRIIVNTIFTAAAEIGQLQTKLTEQALLGSISVDQWVTQLTQQADAAIQKAS